MVDRETGELTEKTLFREGNVAREFYAALEGPGIVAIEATGCDAVVLGTAGRVRHRARNQMDLLYWLPLGGTSLTPELAPEKKALRWRIQ